MAEYKVQIEESFRADSKHHIVTSLNVYLGPSYHGCVWKFDEEERTAIVVVPEERFVGDHTEEKFLEGLLKKEFVKFVERISD